MQDVILLRLHLSCTPLLKEMAFLYMVRESQKISSKADAFIEKSSSRGWGEGGMGRDSMGRVCVYDDEQVLQKHGGDGCPTLWMYLMPLNCALTNG